MKTLSLRSLKRSWTINILFVLTAVFFSLCSILLAQLIIFGHPKFPTQQPILISTGAALSLLLVAHLSYLATERIPGSAPQFLAIPILAFYFLVLSTTLYFLRIDYSRVVLGAAFVGLVIWYIIGTILLRRYEIGRIGLVPPITKSKLEQLPRINWEDLTNPNQSHEVLDALVVSNEAEIPPDWQRFVTRARLDNLPVYTVDAIKEAVTGKVDLDKVTANDRSLLIWGRGYLFIRKYLDWIIALFALPFFIPILAILAIWIKLDDGGPVFYIQERTGFKGKPFRMYKIRTMSHKSSGSTSLEDAKTKEDDKRITRAGQFIRKSRLDELPQIFNILLGQMAWIGPRPNAVKLSEWYRSEFSQYDLRYLVPPGITGWAQVNHGHVATIDGEREKVAYDLFYAKNVSLSLDILIALRTIKVMVTGSGAK
ncbi:sugar transferase [Maritalea mediterranea]|uniref:Sugar transferase n=1 Tax=Maritalea mediterranea TaxID=2909667 RepID=A0ABS9E6C1_9HYPH|nr:sugar transferase [Maritalea mediterranea]MCF4098419.1 sugar transferase [Maritalea mediterranea]